MARRKFQLTKVRSGDWLLPSNDASVLWRLVHNASGGWDIYCRPMPTDDDELDAMVARIGEPDDMDAWSSIDTLPTRAAAIDCALDYMPPREYEIVGGFLRPKA